MCEKCVEIDKKIATYRAIGAPILDQRTIDGIRVLIEGEEAEKKALHPEVPTTPVRIARVSTVSTER